MTARVLQLNVNNAPDAVDVLCDAFAKYPVMHFVLDAGSEGYATRLREFVNFAVMARVYRGEFVFGIADDAGLQGVATVSRPHVSGTPPELMALRENLWNAAGAPSRARYEAYNKATTPFMPLEPHLHINMLGVRHAAHGMGYARKLLDHVHMFSRDDPDSSGVSLETETETNVPFYQHFGYRLVGQVEVAPGLTSWGFFRLNSA